jgi:hypothetical protein
MSDMPVIYAEGIEVADRIAKQKGTLDLTGAHAVLFRVKGGEIRISLPQDEWGDDEVTHLEVYCMGEGIPPLVVSPGGGTNSITLALGPIETKKKKKRS